MKSFQLISIFVVVLTAFSCDTEDARTPLGITISAPDVEYTIEESPAEGTLLGTLSATASDGSVIQFGNIVAEDSEDSKFQSETPIGALDIDNETGELTIKDASLFDYDLNTEITATVNAISGSLEEAININIFLTQILDIDSDIDALVDLYEANTTTSTNDEGIVVGVPPSLDWIIAEGTEITESDLLAWEGVTVTNGRVTSLIISGKALTEIPSSLANLDQLTSLNISSNNIESLPTAVCEAFTFDGASFIKDDETTGCEEDTTS